MGRHHGKTGRWDVATEVPSTFGGTGLEHNFWYNKLGPDYLAEAFEMAHNADPSAKSFLNESLVEYYPVKAQELYDIVADPVARGCHVRAQRRRQASPRALIAQSVRREPEVTRILVHGSTTNFVDTKLTSTKVDTPQPT